MATRTRQRQADALIAEIERYLAAVDAFRAAGCEPRWRFDYPRLLPRAAKSETSGETA